MTPYPHNPEAERAVNAMLFHHPEAEGELTARGYRPDWLYLPAERVLWTALIDHRRKVRNPRTIDSVAFLADLLQTPEILAEIGGPATISDLITQMGIMSPDVLDHHVQILRTAYQRRRALMLAAKLEAAANSGEEFNEALQNAVTDLGNIAHGSTGQRLINGQDALKELLADLERDADPTTANEKPALKTGISEIDVKTGGLIPYFWLVGADTSGGKTALSLQFVRSILDQGGRVLVFALEMSARQLVRRLVSAYGKIPIQRLIRPDTLNEYDYANLSRGTDWSASNLLICDDGDVTIQEARTIARAEHARNPLALVVVDYIQLASAGRFREGSNREQEISFIGSQCVKMAKELRCPVIAPTQLNDDGKVRESRALKHHAAVYLVIEAERILCVKNRDGERDWSIPYKLTGDIQTFERHANKSNS